MYEIEAKELEVMKRKGSLTPSMEMYIKAIENLLTAEKLLKTTNIDNDLDFARKNAKGLATVLEKMLQRDDKSIAVPVQEKVLDSFELADKCGVSVQMVRRKCESGEIKASRGKRNQWLISETEMSNPLIKRWLHEKKMRYSDLKEAQQVLNKSEAFLNGLKEEEDDRKADAEE
jgi:hypothetical protein